MAMMTVETLKTRLAITTDAAGDTYLQNQVDMVEARIKSHTGRRLEQKTYTDTWLRPSVLFCADWPVNSVASLTVDDDVLVEGADFSVDPHGLVQKLSAGLLVGNGDWDGAAKAVAVYSAGDATLDPFVAAIFDQAVGLLWSKRVAAAGVSAEVYGPRVKKESLADVGSIEYGMPAGSEASSDWVTGIPLSTLDHLIDHTARMVPNTRTVA